MDIDRLPVFRARIIERSERSRNDVPIGAAHLVGRWHLLYSATAYDET
jgi:hypothetical protein